MTEQYNLGADLATLRQLLGRAAATGYVGAGSVAMEGVNAILNRWLEADKLVPLRFTTETQELVDAEDGTPSGHTQTRWIGDWWVDMPSTQPEARP